MKKKPGIGVGVLILKGNKILLGKRHEDPEKADSLLHGEGSWTLPGGKLDFGEKLKDCAYREVLEENGIKIAKDKLEIFSISDDIVEDAHFVSIGFICKEFEGVPKVLEPDEITEWKWFPLDNLPTPMFFPSKRMLDNYNNNRLAYE